MLATKKSELYIINDFNDLMKDTKEKQRINKLVRQYSYEFFMGKLSDADLENDKTIFDVMEDLSWHNEKYAYLITKEIVDKILDDYSYEEEYYDSYDIGSNDFTYKIEKDAIDNKGLQITKKRKVLNRNKVGKDFGDSLEDSINDLVLADYYKNLNRTLETHNFNNKINNLKEKDNKKRIKECSSSIENIIDCNIRGLYQHYKQNGHTNYSISQAFQYDMEFINYLYKKILDSIKEDLDIILYKSDIETMFNKEMKLFLKTIEIKQTKVDNQNEKIPLGWKCFAITEFINRLFK